MTSKLLSESDIDYDRIKNLVVFLIARIGNDKGLSRRALCKIGFTLKKNLGNQLEESSMLPFYWYYYGPFSTVVLKAVDIAIEEQLIDPKQVEEDHTRYFLFDLESYKTPNSIKEKEINSVILSFNINWNNIEDLTERIYKDYSPRIFRYNFYEAKKIINTCNENNIFMRLRKDIFTTQLDNYFKWLYKSEGTLPKDELYKSYLNLFSYYVSIIQHIFQWKSDDNEIMDHLSEIIKITEDVWKKFGEGERILTSDYDNFEPYIKSKSSWLKDYYSHIEFLKKNLLDFEEHVDTISSTNRMRELTDKQKDFLRTAIP